MLGSLRGRNAVYTEGVAETVCCCAASGTLVESVDMTLDAAGMVSPACEESFEGVGEIVD